MRYQELDTVALVDDLPAIGLAKGAIGAVMQVYGQDAVEVEFVAPSGLTRAVLTLQARQVRPAGRCRSAAA